MQDEQMLQYIHKTAEMGTKGILSVLDDAEDPLLRSALRRQLRTYKDIYDNSAGYLYARGYMPKSSGFFARMGIAMNSAACTMRENCGSKIAELMIRGCTTGLTKSIRHLRRYQGHNPRILALATQLKNAEETGIEEMKHFL